MKKVLLSMLLISFFANADSTLKELEIQELMNNNYENITNDSTYKKYTEQRKEDLLALKDLDLKDAMQNPCITKSPYYYCINKATYALEGLNGNLVYPEISSVKKGQQETILALAESLKNKRSELYKIDNNDEFDKKFENDFIPELKNFYSASINNYLLYYPVYGDRLIKELKDNLNSKQLKDERIITKAALIYFSNGKKAKDEFLQKELSIIIKEEKEKLIKKGK